MYESSQCSNVYFSGDKMNCSTSHNHPAAAATAINLIEVLPELNRSLTN